MGDYSLGSTILVRLPEATSRRGRGLGMKVTAEGVETAEQALFLRAAGVHTMQGYRYGKPMPSAAISVRLAGLGRSRAPSDIAIAG